MSSPPRRGSRRRSPRDSPPLGRRAAHGRTPLGDTLTRTQHLSPPPWPRCRRCPRAPRAASARAPRWTASAAAGSRPLGRGRDHRRAPGSSWPRKAREGRRSELCQASPAGQRPGIASARSARSAGGLCGRPYKGEVASRPTPTHTGTPPAIHSTLTCTILEVTSRQVGNRRCCVDAVLLEAPMKE